MSEYQDILYAVDAGIATITLNRPDKYNAFRGQTVEDLIAAFNRAGWDDDIGVIVLTGIGNKAFCTGGDQSVHDGAYEGNRAERWMAADNDLSVSCIQQYDILPY